MRCLVNRARRRRGRPPLRRSRRLERVAQRYAREMQRRAFFSHVSPDGRTLVDRVRAAGRLRSAGEVLAWGCRERAGPAAVVRRWLVSRPHRRNLVRRAFTLIGVGVVRGAPGRACRKRAATYAVLTGRR